MENEYELIDVKTNDVKGFFFERGTYDETCLNELSVNINKSNMINEIVLRLTGSNGDLQVIAGTRRFKALEIAKIDTFKAKVYKNMSDEQALNICLSENIHTRDISAVDIAKLLKQWIDTGKKSVEIARKLGKSAGWVSKQLKLLDIDVNTQKAISKGEITADHARIIDILPNEKDRDKMLKNATAGGLSVAETKKQVDKKVDRIDTAVKAEKLNTSIIEYETKIIESNNASAQIEEYEKRLATLEIERNNLNGKLTDETIKQKAFSIAIVYEKIKPLETTIAGIESEIFELSGDRDKIDLGIVEKQYHAQVKKVKTALSKVEKLQKELDGAKDLHKAELTTLKPLQNTITDHQALTKKITDKTQGLNQKRKALGDMVKANKLAYENYDSIVMEVESYNGESKKIKAITQEYADISAQIPSLRGKSANKSRYEGILTRLKAELSKMELLAIA